MAEDCRVEPREKARRSVGVGDRPGRARKVEKLAAAVVGELPNILDARQGGADVRDANAAPRRDIRDRGRTERAEVPAHHQVICQIGLRVLAQLRRRRHVTRQLAILEVRARRLPDQSADRDRRPEEPVPKAPVLGRAWRHVALDVVGDLDPRARRLGRERHDAPVHPLEIGEHRPTRWAPGPEPPVHRRERVLRIFARAHDVQRRSHEGRFHEFASIDRSR